MKFRIVFTVLLAVLPVLAVSSSSTEAGVRKVLTDQTEAWNRGDLAAFVEGYADDTMFIGTPIARGKAGVLERYRRTYGTTEKRGTLEFTELEVKPLGSSFASVVGRYHLTRTAAGGGEAKGVFSLLFRKTGREWKIILDHTSN